MVKRSFLFLTLLILTSLGEAKGPYWVRFGEKEMILERQNKDFLNTGCKGCLSRAHLQQKVKLNKSEVDFKNPSSIACKKLNGTIRIGKLFNGHSQSFCFFKDGSFLSAYSIDIMID